jgi:hypothetical protein
MSPSGHYTRNDGKSFPVFAVELGYDVRPCVIDGHFVV